MLNGRAMPVTIEHEAPLEVLERFPELLPQLLRAHLGSPVPQGARLKPASSVFNLTVAQESRSDGAFVLETETGEPFCALIIESQRAIEAAKADVPGAALAVLLHVGDPDGVQVAYRGLCAVYE